MLFLDGFKFNLQGSNARKLVWRKPGGESSVRPPCFGTLWQSKVVDACRFEAVFRWTCIYSLKESWTLHFKGSNQNKLLLFFFYQDDDSKETLKESLEHLRERKKPACWHACLHELKAFLTETWWKNFTIAINRKLSSWSTSKNTESKD